MMRSGSRPQLDAAYTIDVSDSLPGADGQWDELLARSPADTLFLRLGWLQAWRETLGVDARLIVPRIHRDGRLIAAAAFVHRDGVLAFAAGERSDYADALISQEYGDAVARELAIALFAAARDAATPFKCFELRRVPSASRTLAHLNGADRTFHATVRGSTDAPAMDMAVVEEKLKKKSLVRHDRGLRKLGTVECLTLTRAADILPRLDAFLDQHIRRWHDTPSPSLFLDPLNRAFYRAVVERLDDTGVMRFSTITLNGDLVAAHFGFLHAGKFIWYKPSFEPTLSKHSPGEVLLKYLLAEAARERASEFDFTIGDEAFKMRFATTVRQVLDVHVTPSRIGAALVSSRVRLRKLLRR